MFERYTEKARRVIFFGRYEASQFGSPCIETEHLLLGLLREDKALAHRVFGTSVNLESIRAQIEQHTTSREKIPTNVDLPLSHECKRVLAFAAEEGERLNHKHIGTDHLLLGLMREENSFAALLLRERGIRLSEMRTLMREMTAPERSAPASVTRARARQALAEGLAERQKQGGVTIAEGLTIGSQTAEFAVFAGENVNFEGVQLGARLGPLASEIAVLEARIAALVKQMEKAIVNHEFEKARTYSDQERLERKTLQEKREQLRQEDGTPEPQRTIGTPFLCIEILDPGRSLLDTRDGIEDYLNQGVACLWLVDAVGRRAYTATRETGLQEFKGKTLRTANPAFELPLDAVFL